MVTRQRKTMLVNPLDEISSETRRSKSVKPSVTEKKVTTKKTPNKKTLASETSQAARLPAKSALETDKELGKNPVTKTSVPLKKVAKKVTTTPPLETPQLTATTIVPEAKALEAGDSSPSGTASGTQAPARQTAAQLFKGVAQDLASTATQRAEEIKPDPCTPSKVLDAPKPGATSATIGSFNVPAITASDVFQTELTRATVAMKKEHSETKKKSLKIIKRWSRWAAAASLIPTPVVDIAALSSVQIRMVYSLCQNYGVAFEKKRAVALVSGLAGGTAIPTIGNSLIKQMARSVPGLGTAFIFAVEPTLAYVTTYAMGLAFVSHFETDGGLHDFKPETIKKYISEQFEKRKAVFKNMRKTVTA